MSEEKKERERLATEWFVSKLNEMRKFPADRVLANFVEMATAMPVSELLSSPSELFTVGIEILSELSFENLIPRRICGDMQLVLKHLGALQKEMNEQEPLSREETIDAIKLVFGTKE